VGSACITTDAADYPPTTGCQRRWASNGDKCDPHLVREHQTFATRAEAADVAASVVGWDVSLLCVLCLPLVNGWHGSGHRQRVLV